LFATGLPSTGFASPRGQPSGQNGTNAIPRLRHSLRTGVELRSARRNRFWQAEVHRRELAHPETAQIVGDARAQLTRFSGRAPSGQPAADCDLADDRQLILVGVERFAKRER
jgi:hypothetical protein